MAVFEADRVIGRAFSLTFEKPLVSAFAAAWVISALGLTWATGGSVFLMIVLGVALDAVLRSAILATSYSENLGIVMKRMGATIGTNSVVALTAGIASLPMLLVNTQWIAWVLAIIPFIVACVFSVALPAALFESLGPAKATARSVDLTLARFKGVFVVLFVFVLLRAAARWLVVLVTPLDLLLYVGMILDGLFVALTTVATGVMFQELRVSTAEPDDA